MRLGVDLGTTWTAAAIHTADGCEAVQLAQHTIAMPSVVATVDGDVVVGEAAERRLASDPAAGVREFKRRLGDSTPHVLGGVPYGAEALMGHVLRHVVAAAEAQAGQAPETITLTHPANWGEFKLDLLREAGRVAGIEAVELMSEPEAAARHYANLGRLEAGQAVAVFDFGGGTFDAAVVRNGDEGPELLGTPEGLERLGGVDIDHAVLAHVDAALDGQLRELDTTDPAVRTALGRLRAECTAAKEALSSDTETSIHVAVPGLDTQIRVSRVELEQVVRQRMDDMIAALGRAVASSGLQMEDLSGVLLVGGSSRMPAVAELVTAATGLPTLIDADPKLVVAAGAAWRRGAIVAPSTDASAGAAEPAVKAAAGGAGTTKPTAASTERTARLRRAVSLVGATAAAGAAVVGGYAAYRAWWDDDAGSPDADAALGDEDAAALLVAGIAEEMIAEIDAEMAADPGSLDAFEAATGGPAGFGPPAAAPLGFTGGGGGRRPTMVDDDGPSFPPPRPSAPRATPSRHHDDAPDRPGPPPMAEPRPAGPSATTRPADLFSDPELETVRMQLRERIAKLELPDGTDPADATDLRGDLGGLLDRFRPYPGQSLDDAVASLRYEFEDRVRDFAQDQRIDVLIEQQRETDEMPAETADGMPAETADGMPAETADETPATEGPGGLKDVFDEGAPMEPTDLPIGDSPPPSNEEPISSPMPAPTDMPPATDSPVSIMPVDDVLGVAAVEVAVAAEVPAPITEPTTAPAAAEAVEPSAPVDMTPEPAELHTAVMPSEVDDPVSLPDLADDGDDFTIEAELDPVEPMADPLGV